MILNIDNISFRYNSQKTLQNIKFKINKGEATVILGPNGVGKTTLLKCMNSILKPTHGNILINDRNIRQMDSLEIARKMSYVAQKNDSARITAFDAILLGRRPHIRWKVTDEDLKKVDAAIKRLNLEHLSLKYVDQMSGGELQKVSIARALVQETDIILLDEPTSSLDMKNQAEILGIIKHIVKEHQVAVVMTMHDLNTALRYADKYIFLQKGAIFNTGKVQQISPCMVESVYGIPVDILHHNGYPVVIPDDQMKAKAA